MATGRMLKKNVSTSKKLTGLKSDSARLLWTWILPHLDVKGRFSAEVDIIKGLVVPRLKHFTEQKIEDILQELSSVGLIRLYVADGERYLEFIRFDDFQNLRVDREAESKIPQPTDIKERKDNSGSTPGVIQEDSRALKDKDKDNSKLNIIKKESFSLPRTGLPLINFSFETFKWENIGESDIKGWKEAYPACDIDLELKRMGEWLKANPHKKKSRYRRFIMNWLNNNQDKGGTRGANVLFPKNDLEQKIQNDLRKR